MAGPQCGGRGARRRQSTRGDGMHALARLSLLRQTDGRIDARRSLPGRIDAGCSLPALLRRPVP